MDILPTDILTYEKDTLELLDDLNTSNQKIIKMTFLITCFGKTKKELKQSHSAYRALSSRQTAICARSSIYRKEDLWQARRLAVTIRK